MKRANAKYAVAYIMIHEYKWVLFYQLKNKMGGVLVKTCQVQWNTL